MPTHVINQVTTDVQLPIFQRKIVLTDAQIKALPSTPVELIPAPGVGKVLLIIGGVYSWKIGSGKQYGNIDAAASMWIGANGARSLSGSNSISNAAAGVENGINIGVNQTWFIPPPTIYASGNITSEALDAAAYENLSAELTIYNAVSGNLTGGDPANELNVTVLYTIVDL